MTREEAIKILMGYSHTPQERAALETLIPELAESEDERIRKLLVWQVHQNIEDETNDLAKSVYDGVKGHDPDLEESIEDWKKCLAWLEKQKEPHFTKRNALFDKCVANCDPAVMKKVSDEVDEMLQKEQKPAEGKEYTSPDCGTSACCDDERFEIIAQAKRDIIEKTNIAENELSMELPLLDGILMRVWQVGWLNKKPADLPAGFYVTLDGKKYYTKEMRCNGMNVKVVEPKPAEWSEEDERILKGIIGLIDHNQHYGVSNKEMIAWLKSLRPQPHWEPSDEQMKALNSFKDMVSKLEEEEK